MTEADKKKVNEAIAMVGSVLGSVGLMKTGEWLTVKWEIHGQGVSSIASGEAVYASMGCKYKIGAGMGSGFSKVASLKVSRA